MKFCLISSKFLTFSSKSDESQCSPGSDGSVTVPILFIDRLWYTLYPTLDRPPAKLLRLSRGFKVSERFFSSFFTLVFFFIKPGTLGVDTDFLFTSYWSFLCSSFRSASSFWSFVFCLFILSISISLFSRLRVSRVACSINCELSVCSDFTLKLRLLSSRVCSSTFNWYSSRTVGPELPKAVSKIWASVDSPVYVGITPPFISLTISSYSFFFLRTSIIVSS